MHVSYLFFFNVLFKEHFASTDRNLYHRLYLSQETLWDFLKETEDMCVLNKDLAQGHL